MRIGDRVLHNGHGLGEIVALNQQAPAPSPTPQIRRGDGEDITRLNRMALFVSLSCAYSADRYPFVVRFDSGYQDVYGESELSLVER
jgi:hypothetical protein